MAKRISIINFKGGVGKTTLAFQFATGLVRFHKPCRVLLIDMDHQSSLSIVCLDAVEWEKAVADKKTTTEIIKPFISHSKMPGREIIIQDPLSNKDYERMDLVPASLQLDDAEIELTASHHGNAIQSEWDKRTLVCRWIEETGVNDEYDYIIFDCPPATKIALLEKLMPLSQVIRFRPPRWVCRRPDACRWRSCFGPFPPFFRALPPDYVATTSLMPEEPGTTG